MENNVWDDDIELLLERIRKNAVYRCEYHRKNFYYYKSYEKYFTLPLIVMSACNSVLAVSLSNFLGQETTSLVNCGISLICGIISSIELALSIQDEMKLNHELSKSFYTLAINIFKTLHLGREKRSTNGKEFLEHIFAQYNQLCDHSKLLKKKNKGDFLVSNDETIYDEDTIEISTPSSGINRDTEGMLHINV